MSATVDRWAWWVIASMACLGCEPAPGPSPLWAQQFATPHGEQIDCLALDAMGNLYFAGALTVSEFASPGPGVDLGGGPLLPEIRDAFFLGKVAGSFFDGGVDVGDGPLTGETDIGIFVALLRGDGTVRWARPFVVDGDGWAQATFDSHEDVVITGHFSGIVDFGGGKLRGEDPFIVKLGRDGSHRYSRDFESGWASSSHTLGADGLGNVFIAGSFLHSIDLGGGELKNSDPDVDVVAGPAYLDVFIAKLAADGEHVWSRNIGEPGWDNVESISVDASGNAVLAGERDDNLRVWKLNDSGDAIWVSDYARPDFALFTDVAMNGFGEAALAGYTHNTGSNVSVIAEQENQGAADIFLFKLPP